MGFFAGFSSNGLHFSQEFRVPLCVLIMFVQRIERMHSKNLRFAEGICWTAVERCLTPYHFQDASSQNYLWYSRQHLGQTKSPDWYGSQQHTVHTSSVTPDLLLIQTEVAGNQKANWRLAKELLHSDDRPPPVSPQHASKLCDDFGRFFHDKLKRIADTVNSRLSTAPAYHHQATPRHASCL